MKDLVFATNNKHKIEEINHVIGDSFKIISLKEIGCHEEIIENDSTLEGNARLKSTHIYNNYGYDCFADDTGLEIESLNGRPGVLSARYAGEPPDFEANIDKVLKELENVHTRNARFRTVISLIINAKEHLFEGIVQGSIIEQRRGNKGFGYDSIFVPEGYNLTFAEMSTSEKTSISHRSLAMAKLINFLSSVKY